MRNVPVRHDPSRPERARGGLLSLARQVAADGRWLGLLGWPWSALMLGELAWKHAMVVRFFRRPLPPTTREPQLISILVAVYSGDPRLPGILARNLAMRSRYALEYLYLVDASDDAGRRICDELVAHATQLPRRSARVLLLPDPEDQRNPKMVKLIAGARAARGDVLCILDDDTVLPDDGLEMCVPFLDQPGVGVAFGLPYYVGFGSLWEALVSIFVNSNSLLTYIPYTCLTQPFTLNGMFYVLRRTVYDAIGGFAGLERYVSDDFAVAQRIRNAGYRLAQTPLTHGIATTVSGPRHYARLIQRWMLFSRESVLRHLSIRERALIMMLAALPAVHPLLLALACLLRPSRGNALRAALWLGASYASFTHLNAAFLNHATPRGRAWLQPGMQVLFPIQLLIALASPNRMNWRGRRLVVERGGTFHYE